ncbi:MAG: response regulator [Candidatus Hydrogenedentes bacterium]|nr:response regulator [Candidatus Hydrogenedentota bacterium]
MTDASKILVVDDEAVIRELLTDILTDEGYAVETVSNGPAALKLLSESDGYVLLFTDIMMPEMDGIRLIREAKKVRPSLIPVVMTGFATLETARAAVKEGAYDYVLKPFSLSEIKLAVMNAFERHHLTNENARLLELTELFLISERIAGIRNERELFDFVLKAALDRVGAARGSLMLTTPDGEFLEIAASEGLPPEVTKDLVKMGGSISGWVAKNVRPLLVEDIESAPEVAEIVRRHQGASFVSVPLERKPPLDGDSAGPARNGSEVLAVLNVSEKRSGSKFTEGDLKILSIVANHAAAAIENVRLIQDIEKAHLATLQSMALLLEARDPYTHGHSQRVTEYSILLARELGMSEQELDTLRVGAQFHDIGKVGIPDSVLNKRERLTDDEWEMIKRHPLIGDSILEPVTFLAQGHRDLVRRHHERVDGTGYPDGLEAENVSPLVRVISVVDAYDAMSADRAYRKALSKEKIIAEFERGAGKQFDREIVQTFIRLIEKGEVNRSDSDA